MIIYIYVCCVVVICYVYIYIYSILIIYVLLYYEIAFWHNLWRRKSWKPSPDSVAVDVFFGAKKMKHAQIISDPPGEDWRRRKIFGSGNDNRPRSSSRPEATCQSCQSCQLPAWKSQKAGTGRPGDGPKSAWCQFLVKSRYELHMLHMLHIAACSLFQANNIAQAVYLERPYTSMSQYMRLIEIT